MQISRIHWQAALLVVLAFFSMAAMADKADTGNKAGNALLTRLGALQSMSADFRQITLDQQGTRLQESRGKMLVARGNRFRWHTRKPDEQLVIADGKTVWVYDPGLEQVVIKPLNQQLTATPALLFGGTLKQVRKAFKIRHESTGKDQARFVLKPKDDQAMFTQLEVSFDGKKPASMRLIDSLGQKTLIDFSHVKINPTIADDSFSFVPPKGVDVIRQTSQ